MTPRRAIGGLIAIFVALATPALASAAAPQTITVFPNSPTTSNCFPFGTAGVPLADWKPYMAFIYKNIPAFQLKRGDTIAFDTGAVNDGTVQLRIDLAPTTVNGSDVQAQPFTQVVSNTQTPSNPHGDATVRDFEMRFRAEAPFHFGGGGLIIRFSNPSAAYLTDTTCNQTLVGATSADTSGFFVERAYGDPDGVAPWNSPDPSHIGAFQLTLYPVANAFSLGKPKLNKRRGTARLPVSVTGPGQLFLKGKGVATQKSTRRGAGTAYLRVKPKGGTIGRLNSTGAAKVKVKVTFTPSFGAPESRRAKIMLSQRQGR